MPRRCRCGCPRGRAPRTERRRLQRSRGWRRPRRTCSRRRENPRPPQASLYDLAPAGPRAGATGDDGILKRMARGYQTRHYRAIVEHARALMPDLGLVTDVIVGFPGESEAAFLNTRALLEEIQFDVVHLAMYSPRPGTYAATKMGDDVPSGEKLRRLNDLLALQREIATRKTARWVGRDVEVLIEGTDELGRPADWIAGGVKEGAPALTPVMRQYREAKEQHPEGILLFRLGDFYEVFFDDAVIAAPVMGITLTSRPLGKAGRAPMCGVPHHAWQVYVGKLLRAGHKVVICDQLEAKSSKSVVRRDVKRVLTPGTVVEDAYLDPARSNYLVAAWTRGASSGLAACDVSTGELLLCELAAERLPAE